MIGKFSTAVAFIMMGILLLEAADQRTHHRLDVLITPATHFIRVEDQITLPDHPPGKRIYFLLHQRLDIVAVSGDVSLKKEAGAFDPALLGIDRDQTLDIPLQRYSLEFTANRKTAASFRLIYEGTIHHPIKQISEEYARGFSQTPGIIDEQGVYLAGSSLWLPRFDDRPVTFRLTVKLPEKWQAVSQGKRIALQKENNLTTVTWDSAEPTEEVYLIAAVFHEYNGKAGPVDTMAFLRSPDETLARRYLETTGHYLEMYNKLIGPYPYSKFALIENFWETGYGMPSFTLLGSRIIRFPFILHSSYPHELLHNWWGNGVFVNMDQGNWCEGLTAYLADHLIKEKQQGGAEYRRTALQNFTHYVNGKNDFPLTRFKSRFNAASSAIGYGKAMMLFHMLRIRLENDLFNKGVQHFYRHHLFRKAAFIDIQRSFEAVSAENLGDFFAQWVQRPGAAEIRLDQVRVSKEEGRYILSFQLSQVQEGEAYQLHIPADIYLEGREAADMQTIRLNTRREVFRLPFSRSPRRLDIDPRFDIFRRLHHNEIPPTLSNAFGARQVLILLPSAAPEPMFKEYEALALRWSRDRSAEIDIKRDNEISVIPGDKTVWLFGSENHHAGLAAAALARYDANRQGTSIRIDNNKLDSRQNSIVIALRHPLNPANVMVLLSADQPAALPGLGRKLPHYGKYSYLAFRDVEPVNILKGQWPLKDSPLTAAIAVDPE